MDTPHESAGPVPPREVGHGRTAADPEETDSGSPRRTAAPADAGAASSAVPRPLARARTIARVMDESIRVPFTRWRIGLDPLLGLLPGTGDWLGWAISVHLMVSAAQLGASASLLLRMFGNVLVDAATGVVPLLGDLFDAAWKANKRNLKLLEAHVADPEKSARGSRLRVAAVLGGSVLTLGVGAWALYGIIRELLLWIF